MESFEKYLWLNACFHLSGMRPQYFSEVLQLILNMQKGMRITGLICYLKTKPVLNVVFPPHPPFLICVCFMCVDVFCVRSPFALDHPSYCGIDLYSQMTN